MNRPNKDNYTKYWIKENDQYVLRGLGRYQEDLEKYCDELEETLKCTQDSWRGTSDNLDKQMKALDKAYEVLESYNKQLRNLDNSFLPMTKEQWKEMILKDE